MSDLFDGVKPPREDRREVPQAAAAPAPARAAAPGEKGKPQGVPAARLWLWAVPLLLAVAAVALWSVSVWLLVAAAAAAVLGVMISGLLWWWQRHRRPGSGRTARARSWTPAPSVRSGHAGRSGGRMGGLFNRGGARGRGSGGRPGGAAPSGRRTGSRWSPFNGASRRGGKAAGRTGGGQAATADRGGRLRSLFGPGRRSGPTASGSAAKGRAAGRTGGGRSSGAGSPRSAAGVPAGRWSRSRANPATWWGPQGASARAARKNARRRKGHVKTNKEATPTATKRSEKETGTEGVKRRWWPRRRKKSTAKGTTEKPKTTDDTAAKTNTAPKPADTPKPKKPDDRAKRQPTPVHAPQRTAGPKPEPKRAEAAIKGDVLVFDEMGFPTRPNPGPRPAPNQHFDDRFHLPKTITITKATKATRGSNTMSNTAINPYAHLIDASTTQTLRASAQRAAEQARRDAEKREETAAGKRADAQAWLEKGAPDIAEPLLTEAAALEQDATIRRAAAAAYEEPV